MPSAAVPLRAMAGKKPPAPRRSPNSERRHDQRLAGIRERATTVFCDLGFAAASMRDLSRATGISLAGLYYYFESKDKLLFEIQKNTFETILARAQERLRGTKTPEEKIRAFIQNHLEYFLANKKAMKVLSHESEALAGELRRGIRKLKRQYYQLCHEVVAGYKAERGLRFSTRLAVMSLFGMMNWIYTWHKPGDAGADELSTFMAELFLKGLSGTAFRRGALSG